MLPPQYGKIDVFNSQTFIYEEDFPGFFLLLL